MASCFRKTGHAYRLSGKCDKNDAADAAAIAEAVKRKRTNAPSRSKQDVQLVERIERWRH